MPASRFTTTRSYLVSVSEGKRNCVRSHSIRHFCIPDSRLPHQASRPDLITDSTLLLHLCITYVYRVKPEQNHTTDRRRVHTGVGLCDIITRNSSNKMIQSFIATLYYVKPDSHEHGSRRNDAYDHFRFV